MKSEINNCRIFRILGISLLLILLLPFLIGCGPTMDQDFDGLAHITASSSNFDPVHVSFTGQTSGAPRVEPGESITIVVPDLNQTSRAVIPAKTLTVSRGGKSLQAAMVGFTYEDPITYVHIQETSYNSFTIDSSK